MLDEPLLASIPPRTVNYEHSTPLRLENPASLTRFALNTERATALLADGMHKFWNGQHRSAIERFNAAYRLNPNDASCM